jgi:hypothetical protein
MEILAFPQGDKVTTAISIANSQGMTLRDYFAAKAMQEFLDEVGSQSDQAWFNQIAKNAYRMADTMMKARGS